VRVARIRGHARILASTLSRPSTRGVAHIPDDWKPIVLIGDTDANSQRAPYDRRTSHSYK
jgi:hypothetical protein